VDDWKAEIQGWNESRGNFEVRRVEMSFQFWIWPFDIFLSHEYKSSLAWVKESLRGRNNPLLKTNEFWSLLNWSLWIPTAWARVKCPLFSKTQLIIKSPIWEVRYLPYFCHRLSSIRIVSVPLHPPVTFTKIIDCVWTIRTQVIILIGHSISFSQLTNDHIYNVKREKYITCRFLWSTSFGKLWIS